MCQEQTASGVVYVGFKGVSLKNCYYILVNGVFIDTP